MVVATEEGTRTEFGTGTDRAPSVLAPDKTREPGSEDVATADRRHYHPIQKEWVTFLKTSEETGGECSLLEIEVGPGGGNTPHIHASYAEHFTVLAGALEVMVGGETRTLRPGDKAVAPKNTSHNFRNRTDEPATFLVELRPGSAGFEQALKVGFGLARDGLVRADGMLRNPYHLALLLDWSDVRMPGVLAIARPLFWLLAKRARGLGIDRELEARYCR